MIFELEKKTQLSASILPSDINLPIPGNEELEKIKAELKKTADALVLREKIEMAWKWSFILLGIVFIVVFAFKGKGKK